MKRAILIMSVFISGCTFVSTPNTTVITFGQARVEECAQVVKVDEKEEIKFNCKKSESDGLSAEFAGIVGLVTKWIPWPW